MTSLFSLIARKGVNWPLGQEGIYPLDKKTSGLCPESLALVRETEGCTGTG